MPDPRTPSRRSVVRGVAWSVPVVSVAATAPAFAASPCQKTALQSVTWATGNANNVQTGTVAGVVRVNVTGAYTATQVGPGSLAASNMTSSTVATTRDAFSLVNNSPTAGANGANNYQTVNFAFTVPVFELTFFIDDIDQSLTNYQDNVALTSTPAETPAALPGAAVTGAGTLANPWRTSGGSGDNAANQTVKVTYANGFVGMSSLSLRFWSPTTPMLSTQHLVRIRQMQFRTCA